MAPLSQAAQSKLKTLEAMKPTDGEWLLMQSASFSKGSIELVCWAKSTPDVRTRMEAIDLKHGTRRTLLKGSPIPLYLARPFTPSPDGKHILAIAVVEGKRSVYVINIKGEIVSSTPMGERVGIEKPDPDEPETSE